jgi:hypothetical protein
MTDRRTDEPTDGGTDVRTNRRTEEPTDRRTDGRNETQGDPSVPPATNVPIAHIRLALRPRNKVDRAQLTRARFRRERSMKFRRGQTWGQPTNHQPRLGMCSLPRLPCLPRSRRAGFGRAILTHPGPFAPVDTSLGPREPARQLVFQTQTFEGPGGHVLVSISIPRDNTLLQADETRDVRGAEKERGRRIPG